MTCSMVYRHLVIGVGTSAVVVCFAPHQHAQTVPSIAFERHSHVNHLVPFCLGCMPVFAIQGDATLMYTPTVVGVVQYAFCFHHLV